MRLRLGTRGSTLAVTQSTHVADALRALGHDVELVKISTRGDRMRGSLTAIAGMGVFAAELRGALLAGECDFAVHSLKDLPVEPTPGLVVVAVPQREDPRDALCARDGLGLDALPPGARVGTGSPRRIAQLKGLRPDLEYVDIRGNIETRLSRVAPGDLDAVVLAAAGLNRLGLRARITELLGILPSPGQGALALECREGDRVIADALAALEDPDTRRTVTAERALLQALGGGCAAPIAALGVTSPRDGFRSSPTPFLSSSATTEPDASKGSSLTGGVFALDGSSNLVLSMGITSPEAAGLALARALVDGGAGDICDITASRDSRLQEFHDEPPASGGQQDNPDHPGTRPSSDLWPERRPVQNATVFLPREEGPLSHAVEAAGLSVLCEPLIVRRTLTPGGTLDGAQWVAVTSARTVATMAELGWRIPSGARIAAVGAATAHALEAAGYSVDLVPPGPSSAADLLRVWPPGTGRVVVPGSALSSPELVDGLQSLGWDARALPIYTVDPVVAPSQQLVERWQAGGVDAVVVTSGSVARAIHDLLGWPSSTRVLAFGHPTAAVLAELGVAAAIAPRQDPAAVARALTDLLTKGQV